MGADFAALVADIFPFSYKFEIIKLLISTNFSIAALPANILMTCLHSYFAYTRYPPPPELELKKTTESHDNWILTLKS